MNKIISLLVLLILVYFSFFKFELFQGETTAASPEETTAASSDETTAASSDETTAASSDESNSTTGSLSFFELNDDNKDLINKIEREQELLNIEAEEDRMKNNVRKIVDEAKKVLSYTDLNMQYFKEIKFNNEQTNQVNSPE